MAVIKGKSGSVSMGGTDLTNDVVFANIKSFTLNVDAGSGDITAFGDNDTKAVQL